MLSLFLVCHKKKSAREMREHALTLPDEERREFASKFALTMLALMDQLDGDEEDGDDNDEHQHEQ